MSLSVFREFIEEKQKIIREDSDNTEMLINFLNSYNKVSLNDFNLLKILGRGGFAKVYLAQQKETEELYALKAVRKLAIIEKQQFDAIKREKEILFEANHPFLVTLRCAFQNQDKLFFLMSYAAGGDLSYHQRKRGTFWENEVKFYAAQIILALEFLHSKGIIYQDLKPANVLLDSNGYIKLTDFGAARYNYQTRNYKTFIGTLDFIAPEVIKRKEYNKSVDWWALGILIYQLLYGTLPFYDKNINTIAKKILEEEVTFMEEEVSSGAVSDLCKNFIRSLLQKDPKKRLGYDSYEDQLADPWFEDLEIEKQTSYQINAPLIPEMEGEDEDEEDEKDEYNIPSPRLSVLEEGILDEIQKFDPMFKGFYLDQLTQTPANKTPANKTPLTRTPPPEFNRANSKIENDDSKKFETESKNSRKGSLQGSESQGIKSSKRKKYSGLDEQDLNKEDCNSEMYMEEKLPLTKALSTVSVKKDLLINCNEKDSVSGIETESIVGTSTMKSPLLSPSILSTTDGGQKKNSFHFDLYSPAILLQKEKEIIQTGLSSIYDKTDNIEDIDDDDDDDDSLKEVNLDLDVDEPSSDDEDQIDQNSPFSTKSGLEKEKNRFIFEQTSSPTTRPDGKKKNIINIISEKELESPEKINDDDEYDNDLVQMKIQFNSDDIFIPDFDEGGIPLKSGISNNYENHKMRIKNEDVSLSPNFHNDKPIKLNIIPFDDSFNGLDSKNQTSSNSNIDGIELKKENKAQNLQEVIFCFFLIFCFFVLNKNITEKW